MNAKQRVQAIRLSEKLSKDQEYAKKIGVEVHLRRKPHRTNPNAGPRQTSRP